MKPAIIILFTITLVACNKMPDPIPQSTQQNVVFYLEGSLDGKPIKINAGENNFYMNTYDTVLYLGPPGYLSRYTAELGAPNCRRCNGSFSFTVNDFKFSTSAQVNYFDSVLKNGNIIQMVKPGSPVTGRMLITYYDNNGVLYTSEANRQPPGSQFTITTTEAYEPNLQGHKTIKVKAHFSCKLYNISIADSIELQNGVAVLAFSKP